LDVPDHVGWDHQGYDAMTAAGDLSQVAGELEQLPDRAVRYAVETLRRPLATEQRRDTGGDQRLSGFSRTRMSVRTEVIGRGPSVFGSVEWWPRRTRAAGRWLDAGTRPRAQGAGRHPGTPAKRTWSGPLERTVPVVEQHMAAMFDEATR
jgi:hypothetical protein